ncbi:MULTISPECIES: GNAT family N-acetyltransferase [Deefgea]|nr:MULTISPECIES: GNAT family N-acetyltransferase [Deefgea]MBM9888072.1 GNAT family N-acetyltransferase [Deefgea sp. CFH1-16]
MQSISIRTQTANDIQAILEIQAACYPADFIESAATLQRKQALAPKCSWLIEIEGQTLGYLFCHPWHGNTPPALGQKLAELPAHADRFYIHDLAILPTARGQQLADRLIQHALEWAKQSQFSQAMLVAVLGADSFWRKHQFTTQAAVEFSGYGDKAVCMSRPL